MHSRYEEKRGLPLHTWRSAIMVRPPGGESESPTLSMLPAELRRRLIDDWIACGGGTSSFEALGLLTGKTGRQNYAFQYGLTIQI
jgi:hypothetical protein